MENKNQFHRSLSLIDGALLVIGSMIGSGIFIVSADIARNVGSAGWLVVVWLISGFITLSAALSYGELSGMFPKAGGQYVYLRESFGKIYGFLYGWAFFAVIQTGTIAAVGVAFGKFTGYLIPSLGEENILVGPTKLGFIENFKITAAQLTGIGTIVLLTFLNTMGVKNGKIVGFIFTSAKIIAMAALIIFGIMFMKDGSVWASNWDNAWMAKTITNTPEMISHKTLGTFELVVAICIAMVGALFSSDAWNNVTFIAGEIKKPERNIGLSLFIGTFVVTALYVSMNLMYLNVLTISEISSAPADRVALAAALKVFGSVGTIVIALLVMVSTFGCNNGLILSGARVYYTMAKDGLFLPSAGVLNEKGVPGKALWMQCLWACLLCLSGQYGNLLDFIIFTVLLFYILTIAGIFKLRKTMPDAPRPYKAFGYPLIPFLYILLASFICIVLLLYKPDYTWPGLIIVLIGIPVYYFLKKRGLAVNNES
ncbi:APC family permease [Polluticoccus soli]|uniref:APC family permease n=1 Tax=Polluticoccus soli TaxID=3034150 RepID=UPI0023E24C32|nr:amino acid permease [Flavipsychrobacter sp. JY13-12]